MVASVRVELTKNFGFGPNTYANSVTKPHITKGITFIFFIYGEHRIWTYGTFTSVTLAMWCIKPNSASSPIKLRRKWDSNSHMPYDMNGFQDRASTNYGLFLQKLEHIGLKPMTLCLQSRCSINWANAP